MSFFISAKEYSIFWKVKCSTYMAKLSDCCSGAAKLTECESTFSHLTGMNI